MKRILHCHSTFMLGGKEARAVRLMNAFGKAAQHTVLTAVPGALAAAEAIDAGIAVSFPNEAPSLTGKPSPMRYRRLARYMQQFDLVLTYNWGAMDAVGARRLFPNSCPPLIHHEDGFNADETAKLNWKRNAFRRLTLPAARHLIVPSQKLEEIAREVWQRPDVIRIANGIDVTAYDAAPKPNAIPGLIRREGEVIIGTLAGLRVVKNLPRLVRAIAPIANARLVIVGDGPEREVIIAEAKRLGLPQRLIMPGFLPNPASYIGLFDIFALSSDSEQFPISLVEAMAAGLPVVCTDVGDVRHIVAPENARFVLPPADQHGFSTALAQLTRDPRLRKLMGGANRAVATASYSETSMINRYAELYGLD